MLKIFLVIIFMSPNGELYQMAGWGALETSTAEECVKKADRLYAYVKSQGVQPFIGCVAAENEDDATSILTKNVRAFLDDEG